ncbi:MAG: hypothetical protein JXM79_11635 [Sedimentisphaerales bacterium]|nr:hypothetical protein [Sedimentisphaerales bacterium]
MEKRRGIILALTIAAVILAFTLPSSSADNNNKDDNGIFQEADRQDERSGRGRGRGRFELTEDETNRVMEGFKKRNPEKAKELSTLQKKDPEKFKDELWRNAREEIEKIGKERFEKWHRQRRAEFLEWFEMNFPEEMKELARLKNADQDLYNKKFELLWRKYYHVFDENRRNPESEWAKILLEDMKLQNRRDELVAKIKSTKNKKSEQKLFAELEEVIALRYDVILKRKQMGFERLLRQLDDLRKQIMESRKDILKYQDPKTKEENVKQRAKELLEEKKKFW